MKRSFPFSAKVNATWIVHRANAASKSMHVAQLVVRDHSGTAADFILDALDKKTIEPPLRATLAKDAIF